MNKWLLCALAGALVVTATDSWGQDQKGPAILVVDLERVVNDCDEHLELVAKWRKELEDLKQKYDKQVRDLQLDQKKLLEKTLSLRGADWYPAVEKTLKDEGNLKAIEAFLKVKFGDRILRGTEAVMKSAREAAEKVRKARGSFIVLVSKLGPVKFESDADLKSELIARRVLTFDKKSGADITDEVLKLMNKDYKARKKAMGNGRDTPKRDNAKKSSENK